jgi:nucleotide-binding universal stress UspA family protein
MRKILVAIDGSENALRALDFAAQQARYAPPAELHVLNVQPAPSANTAWEIYVTAARIEELAAERARAVLEAATERLRGSGCTSTLEQLDGDPAETVARRAAELGCESIVMGTHGLSPLGVLVLGSVAQKVMHHTTIPVTLVKERPPTSRRPGSAARARSAGTRSRGRARRA